MSMTPQDRRIEWLREQLAAAEAAVEVATRNGWDRLAAGDRRQVSLLREQIASLEALQAAPVEHVCSHGTYIDD